MKFLISCLLFSLPLLISAQPLGPVPPLDQAAKPKPLEPVLVKDHSGLGRIGVRLAFVKDTGLPQIVGMVRGGPAADYGFQIGDVIIKIDKNFTNSLSEDEIKLALHGEAGTGVELTVQRGDDPRLVVHAVERRILPATSQDIVTPALIEGKL
jgi:C-terminal processing protease CtpA/Prc